MRKRGVSLVLAGFVTASTLVMSPAQAACQATVGRPVTAAPAAATPLVDRAVTNPTDPGAALIPC